MFKLIRFQSKLALSVVNLCSSAVLITSISLCFLNSYNGTFVFDDSEAIINNKDAQETPLLQIFKNDFWGIPLSHESSHKSYRPLTVLTFRFHYWFKGYLDPADFHAMNIILHMIVSNIILFIFQIFLDWKEPQTAFLAAMLFAVHPIHTEAVSGIVGRADILSSLFMCLSLLSYYKSIHSTSMFAQYNFMLLCVANSILAMFCKETGITILVICIIYDIVIVNKILPFDLIKIIRLKYSFKDTQKFVKFHLLILIRCTTLALIGILLVLLRLKIMGFTKPTFKPIDNPIPFLDNFFLRIINYNYIYCLNLWLLFCPDWLCFDWSMGCVPLIYGLESRISFVILMWTIFGIFLTIIFSKKNDQLTSYITMAITVLIITFLPASNLFFTVGFVLAERTLYIPSAGHCLLIAIGFKKLSKIVMHPKLISVFYCTLLIFFVRSWLRSDQWKTGKSLFQSGLKVCPLNAKVHYNVAKNAADKGFTNYAKLEYKEALKLYPAYAQALNNLANIYKDEHLYFEAEKFLKKAVEIQNDFATAWMNLGIVFSETNKHEESEKCYFTAILHRIMYSDCYYNLGLMYLANKNYEKALNAWKKAIKQKPIHHQSWTNMILLFDNLRKKKKALKISKQALSFIPKDPIIHFNLGNILGKNKNFEEAEYHFKIAVFENSKNAIYYTNLGVLYHRWNKHEIAEMMYKIALKLDPQSNIIKKYLNNLKNLKLKKKN